MNRTIAALAIATLCLCGCARRADVAGAAADRYVRLALAVAARDPDSLDFYAGPPAWRTEAAREYRPLDAVRRDLVALDRQVASIGDEARRRFLARQVAALVARIDILGGARLPFDREAALLFGAAVPAPDPAAADAVKERIGARLPGRGDLRARYLAFLRASIVPPADVPRVFAAALAACRTETLRHLRLPADERIAVAYAATNSPWSAFTRYTGHHRSTLEVNTAFAFTRDDLADLACHEGYPGHHTIYVLQDEALVRGARRIEFAIEPLFSPQSLLDEGAASYAPALALPSANPIGRLVAALDPERLAIARRYVDGELEFARAAAALEGDTLLPSADATLKFVNEFRTYVVTYTAGRQAVARVVESAGDDDARWNAYRTLVLAGTFPAAAPLP